MGKIAALLAVTAIIGFVALQGTGSSQPASAGPVLPPGGIDEFDVNGEVFIDCELGCGAAELVALNGTLSMERSDPSPEGTIDVEIVALHLKGTSNLFGGPTPIELRLNPNGGPALGLVDASSGFPAESFFDIPFMDVTIGDFEHYLNKTVQMFSLVDGVPVDGNKFDSGSKEHPIIDNNDPDPITGLRGYLSGLNIDIKPPEKTYTVTVMKQHDGTKAGLPGWEMNIYRGLDCDGISFDSVVTDENGLAEFTGLAAGSYSVMEKMQPGWNNVTPLCQNTAVPAAVGGASGLPACPVQPNLPFPDAGCDEFNSAATIKMEFTNPPSAPIDCDLGGPTQITRSAVSGTPDNIQTEIVAMELTGLCAGAVNVTVHESSVRRSTGKITEQQNDIPGELEFSADSFFDVFVEVDVSGTTLHNQLPIRMACKIDEIPPYSCLYEPNVGLVDLYNADEVIVGRLIHAAHIPLDPKKKLMIFENAPKVTVTPTLTPPGETVTPTPTLNPEFGDKVDVCIDAQVIANPGAAAIWTKAQIDTLVEGADAIWGRANINITWNNNITDIEDPNPPPAGPGQVGDIIDTFKSDTEFESLGDNANTTGKEKCVRIFFIRHFVDNDGAQYETTDGDVTLAEVDGKGPGHYVVVSLKAKDNAQTFAHELGHIFGLQHNDVKTNNLMGSFKDPAATLLNKDQMRTARAGAASIAATANATPTGTPATATPTPSDVTPTATPTLHDTPEPTDTPVPPTATPRPGGDGDANKDGTVDSRDALLLLQWVGGLFTGPLPNADTNGSGAVNAIDGALILQFVAGLLDRLPWP